MDRRQILIVDDYPGGAGHPQAHPERRRLRGLRGHAGRGGAVHCRGAAPPALILLDVNLPDISGTEVCARLKGNPATSDIPVIQITGAWGSESARRSGGWPAARTPTWSSLWTR